MCLDFTGKPLFIVFCFEPIGWGEVCWSGGGPKLEKSWNEWKDWWGESFDIIPKDKLIWPTCTHTISTTLSDHPTAIGQAHALMHMHTHTHSYKHILYTQQVELRVWELEGKSLLISGFQSCLCLSFHWHSHGFSSLLPSSLPPYTHFLYCYWWTQTQLQLNAVQTVTHMWGMPHINMWRDRKKVRGGRGKRRWGEEYSWVQTMQVVHQGGEMKKWVC